MKNVIENDLLLVLGGNLADDGAALAARGVNDIRGSVFWGGGMFVGIVETYVGAAEFFGGWLAESLK